MERYNKILQELRHLVPHSTDVRIQVDTNEEDIKTFTEDIKEFTKNQFTINVIIDKEPEQVNFSCFRNYSGEIKLLTNG